MTGEVYRSTGSYCLVKTSHGDFLECSIKGKLRLSKIDSTNPIATGDEVEYEIEKAGDKKHGVIKKVLPRKNYIIRKSVNLSKRVHIIACNIDQVFLVVSLYKPTTSTTFIDRFLLSTTSFGIPSVLIFNKVDIYLERHLQKMESLKQLYSSLGYPCFSSSVTKPFGIEDIQIKMKGKTSLFSGHSGVGKSSLVNAIEPSLNLKTANISEQHSLGQHTTTFAEKIDLNFGASIIDSPGIKGFGIVDIEKEEIGKYFVELFDISKNCKFHNCIHINEPDCAVKQALKEGKIAPSRYESYLQIMSNENDRHQRQPI